MGKTAIITGGTSGIGLVGATQVAKAGFDLVLLCRNVEKGEHCKAQIQAQAPDVAIDVVECELDRLASVAQVGRDLAQRYASIELLINNAGTAEMAYSKTEDGVERTFAVNHLAHFVLTHHLLPALKKAGATSGARIVHTASEAHYMADPSFVDDVNWERRKYFVFKAYCDSKLANVLFSNDLAARLEGTGIVSNCFHPGRVATNIWPDQKWYEKLLFGLLKKIYLISPEKGARPMVHLALDPEMANRSGIFFFEMKEKDVKSFARDDQLQAKLWQLSEQLTQSFL
ncbi:retinol dehydrogenase 13 [gamma proteobacterium HTCC5015]|nr:retinol dehydrogenase 13 [gamma proteobacterium HTCC5015]